MTSKSATTLLFVMAVVMISACVQGHGPEKEKAALRLLGHLEESAGPNRDSIAAESVRTERGGFTAVCPDPRTMSSDRETVRQWLKENNPIESLYQTAEKFKSSPCQVIQATIAVQNYPKVEEMEKILGKARSTEAGVIVVGGEPLDAAWHKYGLLNFAVIEGKIYALGVAFRGNFSPTQR